MRSRFCLFVTEAKKYYGEDKFLVEEWNMLCLLFRNEQKNQSNNLS